MSLKVIFSLVLMLLGHQTILASPSEDLSSPSQEVRDAAAAELRKTYQPIPRSKWSQIVEEIKVGETKSDMLKRLLPVKPSEMQLKGNGKSHCEIFALDNEWTLQCWVNDDALTIYSKTLVRSSKFHVWVPPPEEFTGKWITYYINGQKGREIAYQDGVNCGDYTAFHPNGNKQWVKHYIPGGVIDGDEIRYYPSGKTMFTARYSKGLPVGTWTRYDEEGKVVSIEEHPSEKVQE